MIKSAILILTLLMEPLTRKCALQAKQWEYSPENGADLVGLWEAFHFLRPK